MNIEERIEKMEELNELYDRHGEALADSEMSGDRREADIIGMAIGGLVGLLFGE